MIVYCVICRQKDASVLCELHDNSDLKGNAPQVTTALLEHLCAHPETFNEGDLKTYVNRSDGGGGSSRGGGGSGFFGRGRGRQQQQQDPNDMFNQFLHACTIPITSVTADEELDLGNIQEHYFHVWNYDGVFYCCLSDDRNQKDQKVNFAFLQAISKEFVASFNRRRIQNCNAYALDKQFRPILRTTLHYYNTHHNELSKDQQVTKLLAQVEDMKAVLGRNINLLLERETRLDRLVDKSEQLKHDTQVFKKRTSTLVKDKKWKNVKYIALITFIVSIFIYMIIAASCGGVKLDKCREGGAGAGGGGHN